MSYINLNFANLFPRHDSSEHNAQTASRRCVTQTSLWVSSGNRTWDGPDRNTGL